MEFLFQFDDATEKVKYSWNLKNESILLEKYIYYSLFVIYLLLFDVDLLVLFKVFFVYFYNN